MIKLCREICLVLILLCVCFTAGAQAKIYTKKARLADFPTKVTKVVLTGNTLLDESMQREVQARWYLSPFEFCTVEEFNAQKKDPSYYFLRFATKDKQEGTLYVSLLKGGKEDVKASLDSQFEVLSLPCGTKYMSSGREMIFFPAMLDIVQQYIVDASVHNTAGYLGLASSFRNVHKMRGMSVLVAREDVVSEIAQADSLFTGNLILMDEDEVDAALIDEQEGVVVSYSIAPDEPSWNANTYVMLIDAYTHDLYYYARHKYRQEGRRGFRKSELKFINFILKQKHENGEDN